jgi:hypothetical protein
MKSILLFILFQVGIIPLLVAQHYVFIEAEGQQPFYLKKGGDTYSSSATGFIILSKINSKDIDFVIGFPNKLYPEVSFRILAVQQDRGFALRQLEGKGWVLVDRQNASVISGGVVDSRQPLSSATTSSVGFADLLADATGDKTLLEKSTVIVAPTDKASAIGSKSKTNITTSKSQGNIKQANKTPALGIIRSSIQLEDSSLLRIAYFDKGIKNNWDTIIIEIEKRLETPFPHKPAILDFPANSSSRSSSSSKEAVIDLPKQSEVVVEPVDCSHPIALPKDVRELQRKITKARTIEEQLEIAVKAFNEKCFTTKQVKELGAIFWEEQNRLTFYTRLKNYVADPSLYGELEQSFLQAASRKAFRDMLKKQQL